MPIYSQALENLPQYAFARVAKKTKEVEARDECKVTNLRIGIPDREAPRAVKNAMARLYLQKDSTLGYPVDMYDERGIPELTDAIINHYHETFGTDIKRENVAVTNWSKEVLHQLPRLYEPGTAVIPNPKYPAYPAAALLAGHGTRSVPSCEENGWNPEIEFKEGDRLLFFCDPNNPTGSVANETYYRDLSKEMKKHNVRGIFDKAYVNYTLDGDVKPVSITQVPELMDLGHEVVSLSKHNNFVGLGLGYVVSSKENIDRWLKLASNFSQGVEWIKQKGGVVALTDPEAKREMEDYIHHTLKERRDVFVPGLNKLGLKCPTPKAAPYLFPKIPEAFNGDDEKFAFDVLDKAHVAMMPGSYFGESETGVNCGKGYVRPTLFQPKEVILDALKRMEETRSW